MIRIRTLLALVLILPFAVAEGSNTFRDELLKDFPLDEVNEHTCRRVQELARNTVTPEKCLERVEEANSYCRSLAPKYVPDNPTQDDIPLLGAIAMVCPIARVLDIGFQIKDGKAFVQWNELPPEQ